MSTALVAALLLRATRNGDGNAPAECDAVVAHFSGDIAAGNTMLDEVLRSVPAHCRIIVYDKSRTPCAFMPAERISLCHPLINVGRDLHTYAFHVATHFDMLPDYVILTSSQLMRYHRGHLLRRMVNHTIA